jgi:hypothetical protein
LFTFSNIFYSTFVSNNETNKKIKNQFKEAKPLIEMFIFATKQKEHLELGKTYKIKYLSWTH